MMTNKKPASIVMDDFLTNLVNQIDNFLNDKVTGNSYFCLIVMNNDADSEDVDNYLFTNINDDKRCTELLEHNIDIIKTEKREIFGADIVTH